jgi:Helicase associated domain
MLVYFSSHPFSLFASGNVPTKSKKNRALGRWVSTQRAMHKSYMDGRCSKGVSRDEIERRTARLEELGFCFSMLLSGDNTGEVDPRGGSSTISRWTDIVPGSVVDPKELPLEVPERSILKSPDVVQMNETSEIDVGSNVADAKAMSFNSVDAMANGAPQDNAYQQEEKAYATSTIKDEEKVPEPISFGSTRHL